MIVGWVSRGTRFSLSDCLGIFWKSNICPYLLIHPSQNLTLSPMNWFVLVKYIDDNFMPSGHLVKSHKTAESASVLLNIACCLYWRGKGSVNEYNV